MTEQVSQSHCIHECVCNKYIDYTNTGATPNRVCNGETWCFKKCPHDTRTDSNFPKEIPAVKPFPNSTQLIEMAHTDWKNREERKHNHDEQDWCSGWISGWFAGAGWNPAATPDSSIRISELEKILESRMDEIGELYDKIRQQKQQLKAATHDVNAVLDELLPKSTGENKEGGWMYPLKFLSALEFIIEERGFYSFQCEDIEEILIAFETYCRQNTKQEGDGK